jgi:hypothetical protein
VWQYLTTGLVKFSREQNKIMNTKLEQARLLASQGKHKKALAIVKKINQKDSESNFESLELEVACLFLDKKFQLAYVKSQYLFKLASSEMQTLSVLRNLAALSERIDKQEDALVYLKQILEIDSSLKTAEQRFSFIRLAFNAGDFDSVIQYGPLLINLSEYSIGALIMLSHSAINTDKKADALVYLSRLVAEMRVEGRPEIGPENILSVLNGLHKIKAYVKEKELLNFLEAKFKHDVWFQEIKQRLQLVGTKLNTDSAKTVSEARKKTEGITKPVNTGVSGNSKDTVQIIKKLQSELENMGANFHKDLSIVEHDGDIRVTLANSNEKNELLMNVPVKCMPLLNDYQFSLDKSGQLVAKAKKSMMNPEANKIMQLLAQMFNASNKISSWKKSYPLFLLSGYGNIATKLFQAKSNASVYANYCPKDNSQISDEAIIKSFFESRVMDFDKASLRKNKVKTKREVEHGFIPIIELINHKMGASSFQTQTNKASIQTFSGIGEAGREVFVQYNLDDPLVTLFTYGFVDTSAEWIYSVPLVVKTSTQLNIQIANHVKPANTANMPDHLVGLADYMPSDVSRQNNTVQVSKLIIPGAKHTHSLRAVLAYVLKRIDSEGIYSDSDRVDKEVEFIERQIIDKNKAYWESLEDLISTQQQSNNPLPGLVSEPLNELCGLCLNHMKRYYSQMGYLLKA